MSESPFLFEQHVAYIKAISHDTTSFEYTASQHFRMSGVYWGLTALSLLGKDINTEMDVSELKVWVMECQHPSGGFGGSVGHDPHMLYTLSAIQILALCDGLHLIPDRATIAQYIGSLQQPDGSFAGDQWGEIDTRFSYCALSALAILGELNNGHIAVDKAVEFIGRCRNFDGGFGAVPGAESHAGQIFCCVGALSITNSLHLVDENLLGWWLSERQCDSGGLNGRPEKQADVCYSWWILSCLTILGRMSWINGDKLIDFILKAQGFETFCIPCGDVAGGGIADRPGNMVDIFHTFFGICGLSLLGYFKENNLLEEGIVIEPTYALPKALVEKLGLPSQKLPKNQLSNPITATDLKIGVTVIKKDNSNISTIIKIYNTGPYINKVFQSETAPTAIQFVLSVEDQCVTVGEAHERNGKLTTSNIDMAMKQRVTSQMVENKIQHNRTLDVQRRLYAEFSCENDKLLYAANAQARVEARRRITQQNLCNQEQQFEDRTREEHYQKRIQSMMNTQNDALAIEMNREKNDEERRAREIQRICEDAPELRDLERALKIAYMNKDRAAQHQEKLALMAAESRRLEAIEDQMEYERQNAQKADALKLLERKKLFDEQRIVLQRQIKEREDLLLEAQKQAELDKNMVNEIVAKINQEDQEEFLSRKKRQEETAKMVRDYEEQRMRELEARKRAEKAEEERILEYNRSMDARNEGVAAKKQAKRDEDDRILAKIVEETERKRREDEEFNNLRDMLWEEELEAKKRQDDESRRRAARLMKEEMMKANSQMMENKAYARRAEAEAEARMVELMKKKFAEDEEKERSEGRQRREAKMKHMALIEKQRQDRRSMYDAEKMAEAAETAAALEREDYRLRVIREARKRLLEEHAAKLQGFMPNGAFSNQDEFEVFQTAAHGSGRK